MGILSIWAIIGLIVVAFVFIDFVGRLGNGVPILELMIFVAGLQWIIGPIIEYNFPIGHFKYYMYVDEPVYMSYVVPAYLAFAAAVYLSKKPSKSIIIPVDKLKEYKEYGVTIFIIGMVFDLVSESLPGFIGFFAFLIGNFKFAGAIILYFSGEKRLMYFFYGAVLLVFFRAIQGAMFHDFILWSTFFYMFWAIKNKPTKKTIYITVIVASFSLFTLQTIKAAYREQIWDGYGGNKIALFATLAVDAVFNSGSAYDLDPSENNIRLNQGWIISAIMDEVPDAVPFQNGRTITEAFTATLLPRFLAPDKKKAGGRENFMILTGLALSEGTSMGISIIGEGYANFGIKGGIIFMGVWGWFLGWFWVRLLNMLKKNPLLLAFLPLIYLQVIKAETELSVVLNHLIKATIVVFVFFWIAKSMLSWNIRPEQPSSA